MTTMAQVLLQPRFSLLENLTIHNKIKLGKGGAKAIASACPALKHVGWKRSTAQGLQELILHCRALESLKITLYNLRWDEVSPILIAMGARLKHLQLKGGFCPSSGYLSLNQPHSVLWSKSCPNLRSLSLEQRSGFGNGEYAYMAERDRVSDQGLIVLLDNCAHLEHLTLNRTKNVTTAFFGDLLDRLEARRLPALRNLTAINIPCLEDDDGDDNGVGKASSNESGSGAAADVPLALDGAPTSAAAGTALSIDPAASAFMTKRRLSQSGLHFLCPQSRARKVPFVGTKPAFGSGPSTSSSSSSSSFSSSSASTSSSSTSVLASSSSSAPSLF